MRRKAGNWTSTPTTKDLERDKDGYPTEFAVTRTAIEIDLAESRKGEIEKNRCE